MIVSAGFETTSPHESLRSTPPCSFCCGLRIPVRQPDYAVSRRCVIPAASSGCPCLESFKWGAGLFSPRLVDRATRNFRGTLGRLAAFQFILLDVLELSLFAISPSGWHGKSTRFRDGAHKQRRISRSSVDLSVIVSRFLMPK